ncbi:hypothetical protein DHEL01_v204057 [Diaporthe helianthi]|uniref:Uncharacterized protein n=1 Tax=Diaporthe helianthi TaxID=158607 RepID=A0A2P5I4V6_DIAHE|nr:hypothetical protein DHEL01_v204057 [Diaporthe helianthi]
MERPVKRQRIAPDSLGTDDEDELDCEPNELNQRRDPVYQLEQARVRASNKLKSRFEDIFAKYERDFTGIGDEIDLRTGRVVVNNGHLQSITGVQEFGQGGEDQQEDAHGSENHLRFRGISEEAFGIASSADMVARSDARMVVDPTSDVPLPTASSGGTPRLPSMMPPAHQPLMPPSQPFGLWEMGRTQVADPTWRAPELPQPAFMSARFVSQAHQRPFGTGQITRMTRGHLVKTRDQDGDEEDVLLRAPDNLLGTKESPLIKRKFPPVGSSPNNDPNLHEMIQDVIKTMAATSPSAEQSRKRSSSTGQSSKPTMKSVSSDTDNYCIQGEEKTSGLCLGSAGKSTAVSPGRGVEAPRYGNKQRGHTVTGRKTRQPEAPAEQRIAGPKDGSDATGMDEDFLDVTGNTPRKPAGRTFYVEIKARKIGQTDSFAQYHGDSEVGTLGRSLLGVDASPETLEPPSCSRPWAVEKPAKPPGGPGVVELAVTSLGPEVMKSGTQGDLSKRKTLGSASASIGADEMSTIKQNGAPASTELGSQPPRKSRPSLPQNPSKEQFGRNIVDPSYTFSDEENLLPRKSTVRRKSEPASAAGLAVQDALRLGHNAKAGKLPPKTVTPDASVQDKRATRISPQPVAENHGAARVTGASSSIREPSPVHVVFDGPSVVTKPPSHRRTRRKRQRPGEPGLEHSGQQATPKAERRSLRSRYQNEPANGRRGSPRLTREPSPVAVSLPAVAKNVITSAKPPQIAESAPLPPSTPRPKYKSRPGKPETSRPGLISLLSDDDDDEDEISFQLADFTPSGYHRILTLRQDGNPLPTASSAKKTGVASLLFGPSSCSNAGKHSTPGCENKNTNGERRRHSTDSLKGSVVKFRNHSPRTPSPSASVVQTPGGTKRRCGEGGFRCDRDFCFMCISI